MSNKVLAYLRKGSPAFHPILFGMYPALSLYASNVRSIHPAQLIRPLVGGVLLACLAWAVLFVVLRNWHRAALAASALMVCFYGFSHIKERVALVWIDLKIHPADTKWPYLLLWLAAMALMVVAFSRLRAASGFPTRLATVVGIGLLVGSTVQIWSDVALGMEISERHKVAHATHAPAKVADPSSPDVYYIVLDGYGREDAMRRYVGYDNRKFLKALRERGFFVADQSLSNYTQTELSIASSLNMDFAPNLVDWGAKRYQNREALDAAVEYNKVSERFEAEGYETVFVSTGFPFFRAGAYDIMLLDDVKGLTPFEAALLDLTPVRAPRSGTLSSVEAKRRYVKSAYRHLERLGWRVGKPRFVFAHILAPHPPFVFEADGSPRTPVRTGLHDGSAYFKLGGTQSLYREGYTKQIEYINKLTLDAIDAIIARSKVPPIIILQGDHGSKIFHNNDSLERTVLAESMPILNAYFVPDKLRERLYPKITPVNSFRLVLSHVFGDDLPLLPDRNFYAAWETPFAVVDVTDRIGEVALGTLPSSGPVAARGVRNPRRLGGPWIVRGTAN